MLRARTWAIRLIFVLPLLVLGLLVQSKGKADPPIVDTSAWQDILLQRLAFFGHHNWIVVANAAYPAQARSGTEVVLTGADQLDVLAAVLSATDDAKHVKPVVYNEVELKAVPEQDAPGMDNHRVRLAQALGSRLLNQMTADQAIQRMDKVAETNRVLVLKTNQLLPYTTIFIELTERNWSPDAEQRLRQALK